MSTSSPELTESQIQAVRQTAARMLGSDVLSVRRVYGGRNSQVYQLSCGGSQDYALKAYFRHSSDNRDRLATEYSALQFLWENGIRAVPQPLGIDVEAGCVLFQYIDGLEIEANTVTDREIKTAVDFLVGLKELKSAAASRDFRPASEACFSIRAIVENIRQRLDRLAEYRAEGESYEASSDFLNHQLLPRFGEIMAWCKTELRRSSISFDGDIALDERTLSPSDFGFHNALKCEDNRLVFLDFEYFGWDDPAKMIVDFLLHPARKLQEDMKQQFVHHIIDGFKDYRNLAERARIVYPLFGLKWCVILLNEFLPQHVLRRKFAGIDVDLRRAVLSEQLAKASNMLQVVSENYERFPYS